MKEKEGKEGLFSKCTEMTGKWGYLVFRVLVGLMFAMHGAQKFGLYGDGNISGFASALGFPVWLAAAVGFVELVGGLGVMLGFFTRLSALGGAIVMVGAWFIAHAPNGWNPLANKGEVALLYLAAFLVLKAHGAGIWSLEKTLLGKETF